MTLEELKQSNNIKDREEYVRRIKYALEDAQKPIRPESFDIFFWQSMEHNYRELSPQIQEIIKDLAKINEIRNEHLEPIRHNQKKWIAWLKKELSTYDIYRQTFNQNCETCKEPKNKCLCEMLITKL